MSSRTLILALALFVFIASVSAHGGHSKRGMPNGWRAKRAVQASSCMYMQCAVSGGNCGVSGSSIQFCSAGEHCSGTTCVADIALGQSCSLSAQENECAQGTCVDTDGTGAKCQIYQEVMPGNPCTVDSECYYSQNADGSGSAASTCDANTKTCHGQAIGGQCAASHQCLVGLFCSSGTCQALGTSGSSCSSDDECSTRFTCSSGKCSSRYTQPAGQSCSTTENCQPGLYCKSGTCSAAKTSTASASQCDISSNDCAADEQCACNGFQTANQVATCSNAPATYADMNTIEQSAYSCMDMHGCGSSTDNSTTVQCISTNCLKEYCTYFTRSSNDLFTQYPTCLVSRMVENTDFYNLISTCKTFAPTNDPSSTTVQVGSASTIAGSLLLVALAAILAF